MKPIFYIFAALLVGVLTSGCFLGNSVNPAAPDVALLRDNHAREVDATARTGQDVADAKDLVRRIDYKDSVLAR